ncbi:MAG TPA: HDIG domain-containing protein [bacterium]|nr:HDIG domain-containing protein [bacterium]
MFHVLLRAKRAIAARIRTRLEDVSDTRRYRRVQTATHIALGLLVVAGSIVFFPRPELFVPPDFPREGDIATAEIIAPFDFPVMKSPEEIRAEEDEIRRETPPILKYDRVIADSIQRTLGHFFNRAERLAASPISPNLRKERLAQEFPWWDLDTLTPPRAGGGWLALRFTAEDAVRRLYTTGIFPDTRFLPTTESPFVMVDRPGVGEMPLKRDQILDRSAARARIEVELAEIPGVDESERQRLVAVISDLLTPNLVYDHESTEQRRQALLDELQPYKVRIYRGERIVAKNERVTAAHAERLAALAQLRAERRDSDSLLGYLLPIGGRALFALFCVAGMAAHFYYFRRRYLRRSAVILLTALLWLFTLAAARVALAFGWPFLYLIPIPFTAILITVLVDLGTALVSTVFLSFLVGVVTGFSFPVTVVGVAVGMVSAYSVRTVRRRYDFYRPALYGSLTFLLVIVVIESLRYTETEGILQAAGYGMVNSIVAAILAVGVLPVFESLFGFTTDLTLLELSNLNHPLLKRLSLEAPGTYHHSIVIGNLSEAAAEAIGANALLARVGAYYHDIGKMEKPEYFVENMRHTKSKHDKLSPSMSALILERHVKGGKELALEHNLPDAVIDFIEQHHGTTVMSFFYQKALKQSPDEGVVEEEYRYPGPKPQTRETAILMLADSVEAVTRTLDDPKPGRVQAVVQKVIADKFLAGQLEECNLTLRDLHRIEQAFLKILLGVFHQRIDYPSAADSLEDEADNSDVAPTRDALQTRPTGRPS